VLGLLSQLADKSLILPGNAGARFGMLETIRRYARCRLVEAGEADRTLAATAARRSG
jgi:predicted ATPase